MRPVIRRGPVTNRIHAIVDYRHDGLGELHIIEGWDIQTEIDTLVLEELTDQSPDIIEILDAVAKDYEEPMPELERIQLHHFVRKLMHMRKRLIEDTGAHEGHVDTDQDIR